MTALRVWHRAAALVAALALGPSAPAGASEPELDAREVAAPPAITLADRPATRFSAAASDVDAAVEQLLAEMTLAEKIGQMCQVASEGERVASPLLEKLRRGEAGSLINVPDPAFAGEAQRIVADESRLGIPLLVGRDVIHGFRTVFPIPLGQAASWNPELVERAAKIAADEASSQGINWTFAPMVDICRDPRWGRIAETLGEDPLLGGALAAAMIRGFQQEQDGQIHGVIACAKHFVGYGLAEGGRDYNRVSVSEADLQNMFLPPFHAAANAGCRTLMTTFSEVNGVPGTAQRPLITGVLRESWNFPGFVVSDWNSVIEMVEHGYCADNAEAATHAVNAGVDMEMASPTFHDHLASLVEKDAVTGDAIDAAVRRILRVKFQLASSHQASPANRPSQTLLRPRSLTVARKLAQESLVLLKNDGVLPLNSNSIHRLAVIGGLADDSASQLGCWALDGDSRDAVTPLEALRDAIGDVVEVGYAKGASGDFSTDRQGLEEARQLAAQADAVILFVGETALLSGESRSRADLCLPGVQSELVRAVASVGKPMVMVVLAGRPLTIGAECDAASAVLYAWHPGTMGGPAIADVLLGVVAPSGKLPVTLPKSVGQIPLYYNHTNTGRPSPKGYTPLARMSAVDLPEEYRYRSHYLDSDPLPLFPFGFGLSYTDFAYSNLELSATEIKPDQTLDVHVQVTNTGDQAGAEVVQLYLRDLVAQSVRPVRELKAFRKAYLRPGECKDLEFTLRAQDLAYINAKGEPALEPGRFSVWVGGDSSTELVREFELLPKDDDRSKSSPIVSARFGQRSAPKPVPAVSRQR